MINLYTQYNISISRIFNGTSYIYYYHPFGVRHLFIIRLLALNSEKAIKFKILNSIHSRIFHYGVPRQILLFKYLGLKDPFVITVTPSIPEYFALSINIRNPTFQGIVGPYSLPIIQDSLIPIYMPVPYTPEFFEEIKFIKIFLINNKEGVGNLTIYKSHELLTNSDYSHFFSDPLDTNNIKVWKWLTRNSEYLTTEVSDTEGFSWTSSVRESISILENIVDSVDITTLSTISITISELF